MLHRLCYSCRHLFQVYGSAETCQTAWPDALFLPGAIFNAGLIFFTFFVSLPGVVLPLPSSRIWLKLHGVLVVACAIVTLALGLRIWILTLQSHSNLGLLWARQSRENQSILQQKVRTPHTLLFLYLLGHHFCTNFLAVPMLWLFRQQVLPERPRMLKSCCSGPNADLYGSFYQFCQSLLRYRLHIHVRFRGYVQCLAVGIESRLAG